MPVSAMGQQRNSRVPAAGGCSESGADRGDGRLAVLIVDDEPALSASLAAGLAAMQHDPIVASSAADALRHLAERPDIGVVITDIRMPDRDGLDLAQQIIAGRREEDALEVIVISGHATMEIAAAAVSTRVSALLSKPFRLAAVLAAVDTAMAQATRRRDACRAARRSDDRLAALEAERRQLVEWLAQARERLGALPGDLAVARVVEEEVASIARMLEGSAAGPALAPGAGEDPLRSLRQEVERSSDMVGMLEELQGLEGHRDPAPAAPVELAQPLESVLRFRAPDLADRGLALERGACDAPGAWTAAQPLERTLDRCLQAAIASAARGGVVHVGAITLVREGRLFAAVEVAARPARQTPEAQLALQIASRRAVALGAALTLTEDDARGMTFRLILPAAPPP